MKTVDIFFPERIYVTDETDEVSDVDMPENKDIPDHSWSYMREMFDIFCQKGFLVNALREVQLPA